MQKKSLFIAPLLTCAPLLHADYCAPFVPDPCCPPPDSCVNCAQLWPSRGPNWIVTPNAGPCVSNGADIFVTGEFIYWTTRQDHLGFALVTGKSKGSIAHPNWRFRPGFKVGLGMLFDHDGWDIYANYTWLRPHDIKKEVSASSSKVLLDLIWGVGPTPAGGFLERVRGKWDLNFNVLDLELGRNFFISRHLQLRPYFGLKGTWQEQEMHIAFLGSSPEGPFMNGSENHLDYWGVGILTGLDTAWHFTKSFSFIGEMALSALWEGFEAKRRDFILPTLPKAPFFKDCFHTIKPVVELFLGLRWEMWYCCDAYHMSLEAGWEEQWWAGQNQFIQALVETHLGDLSLQGFTFKARFDF
jgi:hypothetical protein